MSKQSEIVEKEKLGEEIRFPRSVILIVIFQFAVKFSYNTLRGVLPLYLVDILKYKDDDATVFYHTFNAFLFTFSVIGGIIADSFLGKFKSILFFSTTFTIGLIVLSATATPPLNLPIRTFTIVGLLIAAFGYGAIRPCTVAFGGNQFVLPQQEKQLSLLFVFLCIAENMASMSVSFVAPVLRKDLTCFGELTCYSLVFIVPSSLLAVGIVMMFVTERLYKIHKPEGNVVVKVTKCVVYAISQRFKTKEKHEHWLDYAKHKYDPNLIEDIKSVSSILKLLSSLPIFWSLYSAQSSLWVFQATRMNGEVGGYVIKPDQIQLVNSLSVVIFISIFHSYVYPFLAKFCMINTPLRRITLGCLVTAVSYFISGIVEMNLEPTYAKIPTKGFAQLRIYNTLDCKIPMSVEQQNFVINTLDVWQNIDIETSGTRVLKYEIDHNNCSSNKIISKRITGRLQVIENQATSWGLSKFGMDYKFIDRVEKSNSGNPLVRTLIYVADDIMKNNVSVNLVSKGQILETIEIPYKFKESEFKEVAHKYYDVYLNDQIVESNVPLKLGGVYTILGYVSKSTVHVRTVTVTQPNSLHIFWVVPQQILLAVSEIMVNVLVMEFAYSQAPVSMKAFLQSFWLFLGFFGNLIVIVITEVHFFERKVFVLFLYAVLMTISTIIFGILASFYKYRKPSDSY